MGTRRGIACFGEALIDMLARPPGEPGQPRNFLQFAGGAPANVAVAVARLGGRSHFIGMLGQDMFGDFLLQSLQDAGVNTEGVVRTDAAGTALAFVALDAHGERSFSFYRSPGADMLFRTPHFDRVAFSDIGMFHVCSVSMSEEQIAQVTFDGMRRAAAAGAIVSFDMNLRPMLWPRGIDPAPRLWQALALADVVKVSREEFDWLCQAQEEGDELIVERLWRGRARLLLVTDGHHPLQWHTREDRGTVSTFRVTVQDSTAAGDAFVGGFLYQLSSRLGSRLDLAAFCSDRMQIEESIRFAAAAGALAVTRKGSFAAMPSLAEVHHMIREQA